MSSTWRSGSLPVISADAGHSRVLPDVTGNPVASWDANGHKVIMKHDELRRPAERWVKTGSRDFRLLQKNIYGESGGAAALRRRAFAESVWKVYDGAGFAGKRRVRFQGQSPEFDPDPLSSIRSCNLSGARKLIHSCTSSAKTWRLDCST
jgi:hypothetical protein